MSAYNGKSLLDNIRTEIPNNANIEQILTTKGLNWDVLQKPVTDPVVDVRNAVINYRSDNNGFLGIVSDSHYNVVTNMEAFQFIDYLQDFTIETAGEMHNGKEVFVVGKMNRSMEIAKDDYIDQYISFIHGHNGKRGINIIISPIRMFCTNQMNLMMNNSSFSYSMRHSRNVQLKLNEAQDIINHGTVYMTGLINNLKELTTIKPNMSIESFLDKLIPFTPDIKSKETDKIYATRFEIKEKIENKDDNQNYRGTAFSYLNGVADYISHKQPKRHSHSTNPKTFFQIARKNALLDKAYQILKAA